MRSRVGLAACVWVFGCARVAPSAPTTTSADRGLSVVAEGFCPKLEVAEVSGKTILVYGTYGLEAVVHGRSQVDHALEDPVVHPRQALAALVSGTAKRIDGSLDGLPRDAQGYVTGDLTVGGGGSVPPWLERAETTHGPIGGGGLLSRHTSYFEWDGSRWQAASGRPTLAPIGPDVRTSNACAEAGLELEVLAAESLPTGERFAAVACVDDRRRQQRVFYGVLAKGGAAWAMTKAPAMPSPINVRLAPRGPSDVYVHAWAPYEREGGLTVLGHYDGKSWLPVAIPAAGQITSLAVDPSGALWAVSRWRDVWQRSREGTWREVKLPDPLLVKERPEKLSVLAVQAVANSVWVHAAYVVDVEGAPERVHVLYGPALEQPIHCDKRRPLADSLTLMPKR